jgi:tRNA pseudouridine38-40 synthase
VRYKALVEYDGTDYFGFQRQRDDQPTIQSVLERAVSLLADKPTTVIGAGRTDSGVHASGQVISFDLEWQHDILALGRAMNANLPADIAVIQIDETSPEFHPRFDARRRAYEYHIYNADIRSPLRRSRSWHVRRTLDLAKMELAAASLIGIQDFATFGTPPQGDNCVRQVFSANWRRQDELIVFFIEANAFLYRMVRSLVGSLKAVGEGRWTVEEFVSALGARDRSLSGALAPPHGLYLVNVAYNDW